MKNTMIPLIGVLCLLLSGCAGSLSKVQGAVNAAPDWYDERRAEIGGEGYPDLVEVPKNIDPQSLASDPIASEARAAQLREVFESDARAQIPDQSVAEIADDIRAQFNDTNLSENFLTEAEIEAIRRSFNVPRATQGLRGQR